MRPDAIVTIVPLVCLVTDRRRLCDGCDLERASRCLMLQIREAVAAGIDLIQIRERDLEAAALTALVAEAVGIARGTRTRVVVNDRLDVAIAAGAAGVHLRADSIPSAAARQLAPGGFLIGRSVHDTHEAAADSAADYLIAGTAFPTASKTDADRWLGEAGLAAIVRAAPVPVLAIGGVTIERLPSVAAAGAAGFAEIGLFVGAAGACRAISLGSLVAAARLRFDTAKTAS